MTELLCLYKAFVIFDLLPCMAFTISDENKQLKNVFFVSLTLTFHVFFGLPMLSETGANKHYKSIVIFKFKSFLISCCDRFFKPYYTKG